MKHFEQHVKIRQKGRVSVGWYKEPDEYNPIVSVVVDAYDAKFFVDSITKLINEEIDFILIKPVDVINGVLWPDEL